MTSAMSVACRHHFITFSQASRAIQFLQRTRSYSYSPFFREGNGGLGSSVSHTGSKQLSQEQAPWSFLLCLFDAAIPRHSPPPTPKVADGGSQQLGAFAHPYRYWLVVFCFVLVFSFLKLSPIGISLAG